MIDKRYYFFDNYLQLANYAQNKLTMPTFSKLQKALYFLWAEYSASYGQLEDYPKQLFQTNFIAGKYGPTLEGFKSDWYKHIANDVYEFNDTMLSRDIKLFIDDLLKQIDQIDTFGLITRSWQDQAWQVAWHNDNHLMNSKLITQNYLTYLKEANN